MPRHQDRPCHREQDVCRSRALPQVQRLDRPGIVRLLANRLMALAACSGKAYLHPMSRAFTKEDD
ncbi:hypothetical protein ACJBRG_11275, partial [Streptococcus suis]